MMASLPAADVVPPSAAGFVVIERSLGVSALSSVSQALSAGTSERVLVSAATALIVIQMDF